MRKSVGIFLINPQKEILLHLRDNNPDIEYPGYWGIIGGEIEKNEATEQAIKREIKEELGLGCGAKNIKFIGKIKAKKNDLILENTEVSLFKGKIRSQLNNINLSEGKKVDFFKIEELADLKMIPVFRKFIFENKQELFS